MKTKKITFLPLFIAGILMISSQLLTISLSKIKNTSNIVFSISILKSFTILGFNLIPLYFGINYKYFRKTLNRISEFYIIYFITSIILAIINFNFFNIISLKSFWSILFPISQNLYPYATSIVLIFILLPKLFEFLISLPSIKIKKLIIYSTLLIVILPSLFGKDVWSITYGGKIIFNLYLVILGFFIRKDNKYIHLKLILGSIVYVIMSILMFDISNIIHGNAVTANRFDVVQSIIPVFLSVYLALILNKSKLKISSSLISIFLIVSTITTFNPNCATLISKNFNKFSWLFIIISILILTIFVYLFEKTTLYNQINNKLKFNTFDEFEKKIKIFVIPLKNNKKMWLSILSFYLFTIIQMFAVVLGSNHGNIIEIFLKYQPAIFLTTIILTSIFILLTLLTNKFWYSYGIIFIMEFLLTISTFLKINLRHEPVLPTDMSALTSISDILNMINPLIIIIGMFLMLAFIFFIFWIQSRNMNNYKIKLKNRILSITTIVFCLSGLFFVNHAETVPSKIFEMFNIQKKFFNQENGARINGPFLQFINNMDVSVMDKPSGYSKKNIIKIMDKYNRQATSINASRNNWSKDQTVIFVLSESFSDPNRVPNLKLKKSPIPNVLKTKKDNSSGLMMSSGYGGGTANMEWQSLTGLNLSSLSPTLPTPYSQLVTHLKHNPNITNLFDEKIAVHPYNASLYNRKEVFNRFGFQKFYYEGSKDKLTYTNKIPSSPYISDDAAYKEVLHLISNDKDKSQFIQLSTMQNHLPFDSTNDKSSIKLAGTAAGNNKLSVENYINRLTYTDKSVKYFLEKLNKIKKPVTLVWYGDHLPGIYSGDSMSKFAIPLHQTDYFIFNNKAAKNKINFSKLISPYSFSPLALKQANIKVTPYYALLTNVTEHLPASMSDPYTSVKNTYNGSQVFISQNNKIIKKSQLSRHQKSILKDYKLIQYDLVSGKQYSAKWAMQKYN